ncbi:hypothetical protein F4813DRAFT_40272 [Daldinia decipiens]|uniref:uncharacterized protein n=1 Tax=Daldinia decipiens TaxID=326647 RepID=UPI0020C4C4BD|nr:uncharacterized protein F4813DRAFT_40272 [Daldinia decipiens]KAI1658640.1 hypothetical protein F4813DRAFT_40272 [Daldinia decipiens]
MPAAPMTSAARLISNPNFKSGWGAVLTPKTNEVIRSVKKEADGMYRLQTARDRPISPTSIYTSLFWEARNFRKTSIVFTPAVDDELQLFSEEGKGFDKARKEIRKKASDNIDDASFHPLFKSMRDCRFTLWPIHLPVQDVWVTVILQIGEISTNFQESSTRFDREVVACAIVDPLPNDRDDRRHFIKERLAEILEDGCIYLPDSAMIESFTTEDVYEAWETGHVAYAICREFIRRLKVLNYQEDCGRAVNTDLLWTAFEEHFDIDSYRESMMASCAHRTIRNSGYLVRMALEVPSEKSNYNPDSLNAFFEDQPDEWFTKPKAKPTSKARAKPSQKGESITALATAPASEHGSEVSQPNDPESDGNGSDQDTDADPVPESDVYTSTEPVLDGHDKPLESPVLESIEAEEPHAYAAVVTDSDQGLQEQGNTCQDLSIPELSREATPVPVVEMQATPEEAEPGCSTPASTPASSPAKRKLDELDDAEQPPTKRVKIEDAE